MDEEDIAVMVALEDPAEMDRTARVKKKRNPRRRKMISNNLVEISSVEKGAEVAADSVVEDAIVTIVGEEDGGDRALTPKVKTRGREGKVSQKPNHEKVVVTSSAVVDPEAVGGVEDEDEGDTLVVSIVVEVEEELHEGVHLTANKRARGARAVRKARRSPMRALRK